MLSYTGMVYVSLLERLFLRLSYTGMVYVLSFRGCLDVILHRDVICFSPVVAFLMLSYTVMVYVLSCRGFIDVIVHRDGVCSLLWRLS